MLCQNNAMQTRHIGLWAAAAFIAMAAAAFVRAADSVPPPTGGSAAQVDADALIALLQREQYRELDSRVNAYVKAYEQDNGSEEVAVEAVAAFQRSISGTRATVERLGCGVSPVLRRPYRALALFLPNGV